MKITYIDRKFIDNFKCIDTIKTIFATPAFTSGNLLYFKKNQFEYFTIAKDFIISIDGKEGSYAKNHNIKCIEDNYYFV